MEANFGQLIDMCNKVGWDVQVFLQEHGKYKQAARMTPKIVKQKFAVAKLEEYRKQHAL